MGATWELGTSAAWRHREGWLSDTPSSAAALRLPSTLTTWPARTAGCQLLDRSALAVRAGAVALTVDFPPTALLAAPVFIAPATEALAPAFLVGSIVFEANVVPPVLFAPDGGAALFVAAGGR